MDRGHQQRQAVEAKRRGVRNRGGGGTTQWREKRARILARDPICKLCGLAKSTTADHKVAKRLGGTDDDGTVLGPAVGGD